MDYIYGLVCPITGDLRYIGKSKDPNRRLRSHINEARRKKYDHRAARWIRKICRSGFVPTLVILREVGPSQRWQEIEQRAIRDALASGARLTNSTAGGDGAEDQAPDVAAKKSVAMKAHWQRDSYRSVITAARNDPGFVDLQSWRLSQRWRDPDAKAKMMQGRWSEDKRREQAGRLNSPERAAKIVKALSDPELIARRNASIKASWARRRAAKVEQ